MTFNNASLVVALGDPSCGSITPTQQHARRRIKSDLCLPERLPNIGFIHREAENIVSKELVKQLLKVSMEEQLDIDGVSLSEDPGTPRSPRSSFSSRSSSTIRSLVKSMVSPRLGRGPSLGWENVQSYEVMKAIEDKDIMFLMEVRDKAFPLLLQSSGGQTPLVHAIRTGNKEVAVILLGAFSRWVNHLEDVEVRKPQTQTYLKALRIGLKLAINEGLAKSQSDLIASFMQTLIMSEGDKWVFAQASIVARALNSGNAGKPVEVAAAAVKRFTTKELGKADFIASLEDYVSNATADLLMMGAWSNVLQNIKAEPMPSYYFARDDRVYKAFADRLDQYKTDIQRKCNRRLRWQLQILREILGGRSVTYRRKVENLVSRLDDGDGI